MKYFVVEVFTPGLGTTAAFKDVYLVEAETDQLAKEACGSEIPKGGGILSAKEMVLPKQSAPLHISHSCIYMKDKLS